MKKQLLVVSLAFAGSISGQEAAAPARQNDIMISPLELIVTPALNLSYERLLNKDSGIGINALFYLGNIGNDEFEDSSFSQISPYYRMYFGKGYASGFFVEGFLPVTMTKDVTYYSTSGPYSDREEKQRTTLGVGIGFGGKWVARRNIVFEVSAGIGRRFGQSARYDFAVTGKGMLGIGYRF